MIDKSHDVRMTGNILAKTEGYVSSAELDGAPDLVVTIDYVTEREVTLPGHKHGDILPVVVFADYPEDLIIRGATIRRQIAALYGPMVEGWTGKRIALYCEHNIRNPKTGRHDATGIRVREWVPADTSSATCEECGRQIAAAMGKSIQAIAEGTKRTYGKQLCIDCARKAKKAKEKEEEESRINYL